tara:strand:+ start:853 stop:2541 length:1689 start_codon:yes stop_codon:yes gene_type:complete
MSRFLIALLGFSGFVFASDYSLVTDDRLNNPEPENWLMYRGTYDSHGFSPLDQINSRNVKKLKPLWTLSTGMREGHQSPPIVNDGYLFITTPHNHVMAVNAVTGDLIWRYVRELPEDQVQMHPTNRGVALYDDLVLMATADCYVVALDAKSGEVVWETLIEDYESGYYMTLAPLVASGKVMVGVSGGEFGIRGFVEALDARTGEKAWKSYTIPAPGEPGSDTWIGDSWKTGGVPVWITGSYDKETNLSYWGTGNGGPWMGDTRAGDNLYATSVIAIDVQTGQIRGHHQYHWNDSWDWDEVSAPLLIDFSRKGELIKGLVHPGRNGYLWFLERGKGEIRYVDAQPYVKQDVFLSLDPISGRPTYDESKKPKTGEGAHFCPSHWGGKDWPPAAFNPKTRLLYVPANDNVCAFMIGEEIEYREGREFMGTDWEESRLELTPEADDYIGELQAWHVDLGKKVWSYQFENQNWGPVLATAGNLVFMGGTSDRYFRAFNAKNGRLLWQQRTNSGITGVPSSFEVDGKQYIAVLSGWGVDAQRESDSLALIGRPPQKVPQGGVLWVFGL